MLRSRLSPPARTKSDPVESYVAGLEDEVRRLKSAAVLRTPDPSIGATASESAGAVATDPHADRVHTIPDDAAEVATDEDRGRSNDDTMPHQPTALGDSACTAFAERLLRCIGAEQDSLRSSGSQKLQFQHDSLLRSSKPTFELPNRIQASLLVQRALKFIGNDYHLVQRKSFFRRLEQAYGVQQQCDTAWTCSLFVMLALGELYANWHDGSQASVPGTRYFLHAVSLLEDNYENASVDNVQALNLIVSACGSRSARVES